MNPKQLSNKVIFRFDDGPGYFPIESTLTIYDRQNRNVSFNEKYNLDPFKKKAFWTLPQKDIERIKKLIRDTKYLFTDMPLEESDEFVLDGSDNQFFFRSQEKTAYIHVDNFILTYSEIPADTKAGEIVDLINGIYEILKENGIDLKEDDEDD